jgi:hypothetical protein
LAGPKFVGQQTNESEKKSRIDSLAFALAGVFHQQDLAGPKFVGQQTNEGDVKSRIITIFDSFRKLL